jgi:glycosyltransferase involved in cell wall biosynthesis
MAQNRIAIVVQRYGEEVNGGAELLARWLAEHLLSQAEVHVITTCAVDYTSWADHYAPGGGRLNGVYIHRFPVDQRRDWRSSQKHTKEILTRKTALFDELAWVREQGPYSTPLLNFILATEPYFDAYIFITYLYATTFFGLPLVSEKAVLVPAAHDEPFLYLPVYRPLFHLPKAIVYSTEPERKLVNEVMNNRNPVQTVIGVGINLPVDISAARFREKYKVAGDFLLYAGRISDAKNVPELIEFFIRFKRSHRDPLKLVLIGRSHLDLSQHPDILHLGFVSEQDKFDALTASTLAVMPSFYESLSISALEAWLMETPNLVNGLCEVLKYQCRKSNGGLYYTSYDEFEAALVLLLGSRGLQRKLGEQGKHYVVQRYQWEHIMHQYSGVIESVRGN